MNPLQVDFRYYFISFFKPEILNKPFKILFDEIWTKENYFSEDGNSIGVSNVNVLGLDLVWNR